MKLIKIIALVSVMATSSFAADIKDYLDGPTGVAVKMNNDGTIKSIVASGESELIIGDSKDEQIATKKATIMATLRAKANIAKFIRESLSSKEVMDDLTIIASAATADGKTPTSSSITRQTLETQRGAIRKSSDAILNGLVVLTTETIRDKRYIKVVLGTNDKLILADAVSAEEVQISKPEAAAPAADKKVVKKVKKAKAVK